MRPSGKTNLIAVVVVGAVVYGIWWIVTFSGVYLDNLDVTDAVKGAYNESNRKDDETLTGIILSKCNASTLGVHEEDDGYGTIKEDVPGIGMKRENVSITRDEVRKTIRIAVEYQRKVKLKPTSKVKYVKFKVVKEGIIPLL